MKNINTLFFLRLICFSILPGCAGQSVFGPEEVIVDRRNVAPAQYELDLMECKLFAEQVRVGERATKGAIKGAVVGVQVERCFVIAISLRDQRLPLAWSA